MLGIRCRVDHISVTCRPLNSVGDGQRFAAILADVRPTSLDVRLQVPEFEPSSLAECLVPVRDGLAGLKLHLNYHGRQHEDPSSNIVYICSASINSQADSSFTRLTCSKRCRHSAYIRSTYMSTGSAKNAYGQRPVRFFLSVRTL